MACQDFKSFLCADGTIEIIDTAFLMPFKLVSFSLSPTVRDTVDAQDKQNYYTMSTRCIFFVWLLTVFLTKCFR